MTVETASYISQLDATYPASGDQKSEGDNHLRLIKSVLKTTFPNISGAVTLTHTQMNALSSSVATCAAYEVSCAAYAAAAAASAASAAATGTSTLLTGIDVSTTGTVSATDTILTGIGKLQATKLSYGGTVSSGTANGIVYLNGSKALTSGSGLTFDGTTVTAPAFAGALNGTVGATTPSTGAFTTLSASSTVTLSAGTANGVLYLNGSKVATSGSALTFDGTNVSLSGCIGIGRVSPSASVKLIVSNAGNLGFEFDPTNSSGTVGMLEVYDRTAAAYKAMRTNALSHTWYYGASATLGAGLDSTGHFYVGTSSSSAKFTSTVADGGYQGAFVGTSKAIRLNALSDRFSIDGVDPTLTASYQPLQINGSTLYFAVNGSLKAGIDSSTLYPGADNSISLGTSGLRWSATNTIVVNTAKAAIAASDINCAAGHAFSKTISGTTTFTVSNVPATGTLCAFTLDLTNGGAYTVNWWSGVKWAGGVAPTLTSSGRDRLVFVTTDGGTTWDGAVVGKAFA